MKPYKGIIQHWAVGIFSYKGKRIPYIVGKPIGHPEFSEWIRTSSVIKIHAEGYDGQTVAIETENSRYDLLGEFPEALVYLKKLLSDLSFSKGE